MGQRMPQIRRRFASLFAFLLALGVASPLNAQQDDWTRIEGVVLNAEGSPVPGALVTFTRLDRPEAVTRGTSTDAAGRFIMVVPPGRYRWEARLLGLSSLSGEVTVAPGGTAQLVLAPPAVEILSPLLLPGNPQSKYFNLSDVNYFSLGPDFGESGRPPTESASQIKFRIAVRYRIAGSPDCDSCRTGLYATYSQNSFWHLWDDSAPFFDNNYSPGALAYYALGRDGGDFKGVALFGGLVHESNGRDGTFSRGWQRNVVGASVGAVGKTRLSGTAAAWYPWGEEPTNPDLADYAGHGELTLFYQPFLQDNDGGPLTVQLRTRLFGARAVNNAELNVLVDLPFGIGRYVPPQLFAQLFTGYAENLLTYNEKRTVVRVGLGLLR
jgi:phospholipase A1/A2